MFKNLYKLLIILSIFTLCGCDKKITLNINVNNVTNILYDNVEIASNDFEYIINTFNNNILYDLHDISINGTDLIIYTKEYTYNFKVLENFIVYMDGNKAYYNRIDNLNKIIQDIINKYNNENFIDISAI